MTDAQTVEITAAGGRLDVELAAAAGITRSRAASLMEQGLCLVDGEPDRKSVV